MFSKKIVSKLFQNQFIISATKLFVNSVIVIYVLSLRKCIKKANKPKNINTYLMTSKNHFYFTLTTILSLNYFLKYLRFIIINDGSISNFQKYLIKKLNSKIDINFFSESELKRTKHALKKYKYLTEFFKYGWSGKRFCIPLAQNKKEKIIVLDSDILFFSYPKEIAEWIKSKKSYNLYLKDYENFANISKVEAEEILQQKINISKVNSGLLAINLKSFYKTNSLNKINKLIPMIIQSVKDRMLYDYRASTDYIYVFPFLEQTLHWLTLAVCESRSLSEQNYILPSHKITGKAFNSPVSIHYAGDLEKRTLYKYLFVSFFDSLFHHKKTKKLGIPWFIFSKKYCFLCNHPFKSIEYQNKAMWEVKM